MKHYNRTRIACFTTYLTMASAFVLPPMLFNTFHETYGISYTLLGTLILINFCTQLAVDLFFTFFSRRFHIKRIAQVMPLFTSLGLVVYALLPRLLPHCAYFGLALGTVIFSVAAGLTEVFLSPLVAALPSKNPERDMSLLHSIYGFGVVLTVLLASLYFLVFGTERWMSLALLLALLPIITSILFSISPFPEMNEEPKNEKPAAHRRRTLGLTLCVLTIFLGSAAENAMTNWISGFLETALGVPKAIGDILGLAVFALLLALTRVLYARFTPSITKTLLVSMIGSAICYLVTGLSTSVALSFLAAILIGVFSSMLWPGTLILMEEGIHTPGVAAYALMAAAGDLGASVSPQLLGVIVDRVAVSDFAREWSLSANLSPEEIGLKVGMIVAALFPLLGIAVVLCAMRFFRKTKEAVIEQKK